MEKLEEHEVSRRVQWLGSMEVIGAGIDLGGEEIPQRVSHKAGELALVGATNPEN